AGAKVAVFPCKHDFAAGRSNQPAENLYCSRLARAVGAEQAVDLAILDFDVDALNGLKFAECFAQIVSADRRLVARGSQMTASHGKFGRLRLAVHFTQDRDECVLKSRRRFPNLQEFNACRIESRANGSFRSGGIASHQVETIAESLYIGYVR